MAKGRVRSRMQLRQEHEAAEARERDATKPDDEQDEDVGDLDAADDVDDGDGDAKPAPVKKKAKKKVGEAKPRKKAVKIVRKRVVWVVLDNSSKQVARFDYTKKAEAEAHAEKLKTEKKQTYFVQPLKEEITE